MDSKEEQVGSWSELVDSLCRNSSYNHIWFPQQVEGLKHRMKQHSTGNVNKISNSRPKIQMIPEHMGERVDFRQYYEPQIISIGPFHLDKEDLLQGKIYKDIWAAMYLEHTNSLELSLLLDRISDSNLEEFLRMFEVPLGNGGVRRAYVYHDDIDQDVQHYNVSYYDLNTVRFAILASVLDGCCVLELLEKSDKSVADLEKELEISIEKLVKVHQDLLIMDNQIPFQLLRLLCQDEARLEKCLHNFLRVHGILIESPPKLGRKKKENQEVKVAVDEEEEEDPVHLLDYLRRALLMRDQYTFYQKNKMKSGPIYLRKYSRIGTIRELKEAGIPVIKHSHRNFLFPDFHNGRLWLPEIIVDDTMAHMFLNLVAYEMCPDFRNSFEISSFLVFMSSLINQPEDVKELRMTGIIINELGSDKEVADLFNKMDTISVPERPFFAEVEDQIVCHMMEERLKIARRLTLTGKKKMLAWMGEAYTTFFRSPWTIIALLAAMLGLVLTFIQTWFAIHPKRS
ncbi:hypothetical protein PIB30_042198 [Stylosanthes scabra]|uniref:Uncharacterized protein n=1 Tax=Stylosanthes scabra TaxID=79078 RepID=A0ABU6VER1_9FABA|nr:hypothetical protein [Stylosanthes scabra]